MNTKIIVTTTINKPTKATFEFCKKKEFDFVIIGDLKTPHEEYFNLEKQYSNLKYIHPDEQKKLYPNLSEAIGWNCIQRRSIGFVYAYQNNYEIIATVDDDNIPYQNWGKKIYVGKTIEVDTYETLNSVFDPLSVTNTSYVWHRGYPLELIPNRFSNTYIGKSKRKVMIQADLWDGDPDIDAMARLSIKPIVKYDVTQPYCSLKISPFNSQNTFVHRNVLKYYMMLPYVGRMDDIWPSYIVQKFFPQSLIYSPATVYQDRNEQDLITNLENEIYGYRNTYKLLQNIEEIPTILPDKTKKALLEYKKFFN